MSDQYLEVWTQSRPGGSPASRAAEVKFVKEQRRTLDGWFNPRDPDIDVWVKSARGNRLFRFVDNQGMKTPRPKMSVEQFRGNPAKLYHRGRLRLWWEFIWFTLSRKAAR